MRLIWKQYETQHIMWPWLSMTLKSINVNDFYIIPSDLSNYTTIAPLFYDIWKMHFFPIFFGSSWPWPFHSRSLTLTSKDLYGLILSLNECYIYFLSILKQIFAKGQILTFDLEQGQLQKLCWEIHRIWKYTCKIAIYNWMKFQTVSSAWHKLQNIDYYTISDDLCLTL